MKKKIAICFAGIPFVRGGAENHVESLCSELKKRGYLAEIITLPLQNRTKTELLKCMAMWKLLNLNYSHGLGIDLVIATKFPSYIVSHPNKVTWLIHQHRSIYDLYGTPYSDFNPANSKHQQIRDIIIKTDNTVLSQSRIIYTNSKNTANRLKKYNNLDAIPLYHPPKHFNKFYCENYDDYILSIGRLDNLKRVDLLLKAMTYTDKKIKCLIAGTGFLENHLKKMAHNLGLTDRVNFLGYIDDYELLKLYANCFAVFFAPYDEDYGYVTLEAFLSRKPVITCKDSGGVTEFAEHNINAKVAERPNPYIIAGHINELFKSPSDCKDLGYNGYNRIKHIGWEDVIEKLTITL